MQESGQFEMNNHNNISPLYFFLSKENIAYMHIQSILKSYNNTFARQGCHVILHTVLNNSMLNSTLSTSNVFLIW